MSPTIAQDLRKTASILEIQADLAKRVAAAYAPERASFERSAGDERLAAMVGFQLEQERLSRSLAKDSQEARAAADLIERLMSRLRDARRIISEIDDYQKRPEKGDWGVECACCMGELLDDDREAITEIDAILAGEPV